jgi:hypothetical protein
MRGRWPAGLEYIDKREGSVETKERFKSILCTLFREARVLEVCAQHDIGETRFEQLRETSIQGALNSIEPRPAGRPSRACPGAQAEQIGVLQQRVRELEQALHEAQVRAEIALVLQPARRDEQDGSMTAAGVEKKMPRPRVKIRKSR